MARVARQSRGEIGWNIIISFTHQCAVEVHIDAGIGSDRNCDPLFRCQRLFKGIEALEAVEVVELGGGEAVELAAGGE